VAERESLVHQLLRRGAVIPPGFAPERADDDFHVVLAEAIQPEPRAGRKDLAVGPDFGMAVPGGPFRNVGMETLAILYDRSQQDEVAALLEFHLEAPAQFVTRLGFDRCLAVGAIGPAQPGEEEAEEVVDLGHRGHRALAASAGLALLDADGGRDARDGVHLRPGHLLDELPGVGAHRIEKPALAFGEEQIEGEGAFAGAADAGDDDKPPERNADGEVFEIVLAGALDGDGAGGE